MRVLYLGPNFGTSGHRYRALQRLGHEVDIADPRPPLLSRRAGSWWTIHTGGLGVEPLVRSHIARQIGSRRYDVVFVDGGDLIGPNLVRYLREVGRWVINFNLDNPFVPRDGNKWRLFLSAIPLYDLFVTPRESSVRQAYEAGAKRAIQLTQAADEVVHRPRASAKVLGVTFVGTWMPERGPFILKLLEEGVPLHVFGPRWSRAPEFRRFAGRVVDRYMDDEDYVATIASSKIALAFVSKGNRDIHTTRSLEIPAIGTLLCAERTKDHSALYDEGREAVFWSDATECLEVCRELLADESRLERLAHAGHLRASRNGHFNEPTLSRILQELER